MLFLETLVGANVVGTWRGAGHAKRTQQQLRLQSQMLFDAMTPEEKGRVLHAVAERKRIAEEAQRASDRAFLWRAGILAGFLLLIAAIALPNIKPVPAPVVKQQTAAKPKPKVCLIYDYQYLNCLSGWEDAR